MLTIAGSDSGGAAGLQADLKTFTALGAYGMSGITAVTAQNSVSVNGVTWMTPDFLTAQLDAVLSDYGTDGVKTGFLGKVELITAVSETLKKYNPPNIVIDPVLVNHKQVAMFPDEVRQGYLAELCPLATLVTPNLTEAALMVGASKIESLADCESVAKALHEIGKTAVLIKGFPENDELLDLLFDGEKMTIFRQPRLQTENTHGSGDTLSAAITVFLGRGDGLETAAAKAHKFTRRGIKDAKDWQLGAGHGPLSHFHSDE
ncbi:MAG: bifunctional hydroxymethylpyrimidine kinase/phosphomethylpyrimidine kinase [Chloroflexota bacterium]